jgi:predicted nuclease with TOPRIM domain
MINNLSLIKPLLTFKEEGDFYRIHIFKRKKDQTTDRANHQSVRTIKTYSVYDLEYLEEKYQEIKDLCEHFKARAYISIQRLNDKDVALLMLKELVNRLYSNQQKMERLYDSTIGNMKSKDKRWIVDIDKEELENVDEIRNKINELAPEGNKILLEVPTKSGLHLITSPFRVDHFQEWSKVKNISLDLQKCNPTCLFIPNSLINNQL